MRRILNNSSVAGASVRPRPSGDRREQILECLGADSGHFYFTSGATEAANWALKGAAARLPEGRRRIVTLATEHACVLDTLDWLTGRGFEVETLYDRAATAAYPVALRAAPAVGGGGPLVRAPSHSYRPGNDSGPDRGGRVGRALNRPRNCWTGARTSRDPAWEGAKPPGLS